MKIGIGLPNQIRDVDPAVIAPWAASAEQAGFSALGSVGRIAYPGVMDTVALAAAAGATSRIGLISNILLGPVWPAVLLAKEAAGIDGVSGGRLTLGLGVGLRADDFVAGGLGFRGRGRRFDRDLETFRSVWRGEPVDGSAEPAVPRGTRQVPMMFGGQSPAAFARMARWGDGYIGPSVPPEMVAQAFDGARAAWRQAGRPGAPRLVAIAYYAFGDADAGRRNVFDYYQGLGQETATFLAGCLSADEDGVRQVVKGFEGIGADELILNPALPGLDQVARLAEAVR